MFAIREEQKDNLHVFAIDKRIELIFQLISDENPDIMCLQEIYKDTLTTYIERFKDYNFTEMRHSERNGCCYNLIGVRYSILLKNKNIEVRIPKSTISKVFEISSYVTCLELDNLIIVNCHAPMSEHLRFLTNEHIVKVLRPDKPTIVVGDMNSFGDCKGREQIKNLCDLTNLTHFDNGYKSSFAAYPYDVFETKSEGGEPMPLDHLFYKDVIPRDFKFISDKYAFERENGQIHFFSVDELPEGGNIKVHFNT